MGIVKILNNLDLLGCRAYIVEHVILQKEYSVAFVYNTCLEIAGTQLDQQGVLMEIFFIKFFVLDLSDQLITEGSSLQWI